MGVPAFSIEHVSEGFVMRTLTSAFLALSVSFPVAIAKEGPGSGELPAATTIAADQTPQGPNEEQLIAEARKFIVEANEELRRLYIASNVAAWAHQTDITPDHEAAAAQAFKQTSEGVARLIRASRRFDAVETKLDFDTRRQLLLLKSSGDPAPDDPAQAEDLAKIEVEMTSVYGKGRVCEPRAQEALAAAVQVGDAASNDLARISALAVGPNLEALHCKDLEALSRILQRSREPGELLEAWRGWHDNVGKAEHPLYVRFVELANAGARGVGFADVASMWRSTYDMPEQMFELEVDRLWGQVKPLYEQLHCYTRRRLSREYGRSVQPQSGPIFAHLTGNMWAQEWSYLYPELEPYKGVASADVTPHLEKSFDSVKMVKMAEGFYTSLSMQALPGTFWERSMLDKPKDKAVVCHASAWDVGMNNDQRIKMCINRNQEDLIVIHHELGHNYYYSSYRTLPTLYQRGANDGFDEAVGDTIALSVTPSYLMARGLLSSVDKNDKGIINQQMGTALDKIAFLPFGLLVDKWRWDVFSGRVKPADYNRHWWDLKLKYQGIAPPIPRDDADLFDPGARRTSPQTPRICATSWPAFFSSSFTGRCAPRLAFPGRFTNARSTETRRRVRRCKRCLRWAHPSHGKTRSLCSPVSATWTPARSLTTTRRCRIG